MAWRTESGKVVTRGGLWVEPSKCFGAKAVQHGGEKFGGRNFALDEWAKVEGEDHFLSGVGLGGVGEGGLGIAATLGGAVIPFSALDLRLETAKQRGS